MRTRYMLRCGLPVLLWLLTGVCERVWGGVENDVVMRGLLPAMRDYCATFVMGAVRSRAAVESEKTAGRTDAEKELAKAHEVLSDIAVFARSFRASDMQTAERVEVVRLLRGLRAGVLRSGAVAIGNLEIASALSMFISAVYFSVYDDCDADVRRTLLGDIARVRDPDARLFREALAVDALPVLAGKEGDEVRAWMLRFAMGDATPDATHSNMAVPSLKVLAKGLDLAGENNLFASQLERPDARWFVWDLGSAYWLEALCRLSLSLPSPRVPAVASGRSKYATFCEALTNELSAVHQQAIGIGCLKEVSFVPIVLDVRSNVSDRGKRIFDMLCFRLRPVGGPPL